jgi:hypothetical protein
MKIGVVTNNLINHLLEAAQQATSSKCKILSNKVLNNNTLLFAYFVDQSTLTFQLIVAFSIAIQSLSCSAFQMVACKHLCFTKLPSGIFNAGFQLVVKFNKIIKLIKAFGHTELIELFAIFVTSSSLSSSSFWPQRDHQVPNFIIQVDCAF